MIRFIIGFASVVVAASRAFGASGPSAADVAASVAQIGAQATIARLAASDQWDQVADRIDTGEAAWVALAPLLAPGADAGSAEDLGISLAYALPKNPTAVLAAIDSQNGHVIGADRVCGVPFIEDTVKDWRAYRASALRALARVHRPDLAERKAACVRALNAAH